MSGLGGGPGVLVVLSVILQYYTVRLILSIILQLWSCLVFLYLGNFVTGKEKVLSFFPKIISIGNQFPKNRLSVNYFLILLFHQGCPSPVTSICSWLARASITNNYISFTSSLSDFFLQIYTYFWYSIYIYVSYILYMVQNI